MRRAVAIAVAVAGLFTVPHVRAQDYPSGLSRLSCLIRGRTMTRSHARSRARSQPNSAEPHRRKRERRRHHYCHTQGRTAATDGYTLLLHNLQISANVALYKKLPFDTEKDLTPVMFINRNPLVLIGRRSLPAKTLPELLALMKTATLKAAIPGYGATGHLATSLLAQEAKVQIDKIPYRGAAPALQDILGDHVDLFFATQQSVEPQVIGTNDRLWDHREGKSPKLPTAESFVTAFGPKLEIQFWQALLAPSATPKR